MTLIGICGRCLEESPAGRTPERQHLKRGPHGKKLCSRHANEAWEDHEVSAGTD